MSGQLHVGTSGYAYPEWKPAFYPADLPATKFLPYYAERFATVEINNTFYRFPSDKALQDWRAQVPATFTFAIKAPQKITHYGRLKGVEQLTRDLVERCGTLGPQLGPILFQLPPNLKRDDARLAEFVSALPPGARYAFEFRHVSWFDDATYATMAARGVALCVSEGENLDSPRIATGPFCYARLRKESYEAAELAGWRSWFDEQRTAGRDVFAYLKHDDAGVSPERALAILALAN